MSDLLKEAIADAKAVRETALQNAKMALEEAFTPQLKSMLVAKLKEDDIEEGGWNEDDEMGDEEEPEAEPEEEPEEMMGKDEMSHDEMSYEDDEMGDDEMGDEEGEEDMEEEGLELEDIIRELEAELSEDAYEEDLGESEESEDKPVEEASEESDDDKSVNEDDDIEIDEEVLDELKDDDDDDDDKDDVDEEVDQSSGIGKGTGRGSTDRSSGIGTGKAVEKTKMESVQAELKEYKEAVTYLKDKLHEVNILNAKLLFTNKLFKEFALDNNQKLKVVETFDRAQTTREIKLVYSTLAEQFTDNGSIGKRNSIKESASSAVGSTKPSKESKKVISEESQVANRFRKLAGLLND